MMRLKIFKNLIIPDDVVFEAQDKIVELLSAEDTFPVPGFLGKNKIEGTIFVNIRLKHYGFQDAGTYEFITAGSISKQRILKLTRTNFHLFPNAGDN